MADVESSAAIPVGEIEGLGVPILVEGDGLVPPSLRKLDRKFSLRSSRGRISLVKPKSPLLKMAEIRRGGLRGEALRLSGRKGLEGSMVKVIKGKGKKGPVGKSFQKLEPISEGLEAEEGDVEGLGGEGAVVGGDGGPAVSADILKKELGAGEVVVSSVSDTPTLVQAEEVAN